MAVHNLIDHPVEETTVVPVAVGDEVGVCDVNAVVDAEADHEHVADAGDDVDVLAEVEADPGDVDECEEDAEEDHEAELEVCEHEGVDDDDGHDGHAQVPDHLVPDRLVRRPSGVSLQLLAKLVT